MKKTGKSLCAKNKNVGKIAVKMSGKTTDDKPNGIPNDNPDKKSHMAPDIKIGTKAAVGADTSMGIVENRDSLLKWYAGAKRPLPWREKREAYGIWISEIMLQQTTVTAVIPFYQRFMARFPTLKSLARAEESSVIGAWAGLGYYSRARNIHKAARALDTIGFFPQTYQELLELPGFGPYTARAVASLAFNQKVGVIDGNVIRILTRRFGIKSAWWNTQNRNELQNLADQFADTEQVYHLNQAMMELGATICTPQSPACLLCPWSQDCVALAQGLQSKLPLSKPRRSREIWLWTPEIYIKKDRILLTKVSYAPFLRGHWMPPGKAQKVDRPPRDFALKGTVTHHDIYVIGPSSSSKMAPPKIKPVAKLKAVKLNSKKLAAAFSSNDTCWLEKNNLDESIPSSLIRKAIAALSGSRSTVLTLAFALALTACRSSEKLLMAPQDLLPATPGRADLVIPNIPSYEPGTAMLGTLKPITGAGENRQPNISSDGKRMIFASSLRKEHRLGQLYELEIEKQVERRTTFHDGDDQNPIYLDSFRFGASVSDRVIYKSDTDDLRQLENAILDTKNKFGMSANSNLPSSRGDLYLQSLDGRQIHRLTTDASYEGEPTADRTGKKIIFVSERLTERSNGRSSESLNAPSNESQGSQRRLFLMTEQSAQALSLVPEKNTSFRNPSLTPDGKSLVFQIVKRSAKDKDKDKAESTSTSTIAVSAAPFRKISPLIFAPIEDIFFDGDPTWMPNGLDIIFSSNRTVSGPGPRTAEKAYDLWMSRSDGQCLRRLTQTSAASEIEPTVSPDGKFVYFTSNANGNWQIYRAEIKPTPDC
jgi:A/G-specific adenine glycosylase